MAPERTSGSFGSRLREARERRGISLRQIANATKISIGALEALERNDISRLPGGIFSRAFVRSYAIEIGLDPERTIQDFIAQFPHDSVTAGHPTAEQVEDSQVLESDRRMASAFLRLLAFSLPLAGIVLYFTAGRPVSGPAEERAALEAAARVSSQAPLAAPTEAAPAPSEVPSPTIQTLDPASPAQATATQVNPAVDLLRVGVSATGPCWISAVVDGRRAIQRELQAGEHETFDVRRELVLTAGDAAAVSVTFNGESVRPLGKSGEVVTARVNLTNFKDFLTSR